MGPNINFQKDCFLALEDKRHKPHSLYYLSVEKYERIFKMYCSKC
jgi:hypothetical protein